jgi:hypothetical protein
VGTVNVGSRAPACLTFIWRCARGGPLPQNGRRPRSGRVSDRKTDPEILPGDHIPNNPMNSPLEAAKPTKMTRYRDRSTAQAYSMATMWFADMSSTRLLTMPSHCPLLWQSSAHTWSGLPGAGARLGGSSPWTTSRWRSGMSSPSTCFAPLSWRRGCLA